MPLSIILKIYFGIVLIVWESLVDIKSLLQNLSENKLGIEGVKHIVMIAVDVDNFTSLSLSGTLNYVSK